MREIKFRAWDKNNGMTNSFCIHAKGWIAYKNNEWLWEHESPILMQFTGLKDKNGKEIYEGDIVKDTDSGHIGKVVWLEYKFTINMDGEDWPFYVINGKDESLEVIGNIYENPDLLERRQNES